MATGVVPPARVFKTKTFAREANHARIEDAELCAAILQAIAGQADDLGGGVYKKRLRMNRYRSIILARGGSLWVYEYLFAKQNRPNIDPMQLSDLRKLAKVYAALTPETVRTMLSEGDFEEICDGLQE